KGQSRVLLKKKPVNETQTTYQAMPTASPLGLGSRRVHNGPINIVIQGNKAGAYHGNTCAEMARNVLMSSTVPASILIPFSRRSSRTTRDMPQTTIASIMCCCVIVAASL